MQINYVEVFISGSAKQMTGYFVNFLTCMVDIGSGTITVQTSSANTTYISGVIMTGGEYADLNLSQIETNFENCSGLNMAGIASFWTSESRIILTNYKVEGTIYSQDNSSGAIMYVSNATVDIYNANCTLIQN